jgi:hypothetical protein
VGGQMQVLLQNEWWWVICHVAHFTHVQTSWIRRYEEEKSTKQIWVDYMASPVLWGNGLIVWCSVDAPFLSLDSVIRGTQWAGVLEHWCQTTYDSSWKQVTQGRTNSCAPPVSIYLPHGLSSFWGKGEPWEGFVSTSFTFEPDHLK